MKSIFILGASRLQVPAIKKAKEKGLYVYVIDYDPSAVGIKYADKFLEISTIDKEAVYDAALKYKPNYIITSTSDMPVRTVSWVNEQLGKPTDISYDGAICATDKVAMRNRMKEKGVPIPVYYVANTYLDFEVIIPKMPMQFVLKPADNAASRGVVLVDKRNNPKYKEIFDFCKNYSRSGDILIEEFMLGPEVSVEAYSVDGVPHIITITDKIVTGVPYFVELGHTEPSRLSINDQMDIKQVAESAIKAIGMQNGPTHTEIKITPNGAKLVEIAARLGGDFITSQLVPLSTGVDMIGCCFSTLIGEEVKYQNKISNGSAIRFIQGKTGVLKDITGLDVAKSFPGVVDIEIYKKIGEKIVEPKNSSDRIGHIIAVGKSADEAEKNANNALANINVVLEK